MTTGLEFTEQVLCTNHNNTENTVERHTLRGIHLLLRSCKHVLLDLYGLQSVKPTGVYS
jgi:hypothetical protein